MDSINATGERLELGTSIDLYSIDLRDLGFPIVFNWTPSRQDGGSLWFGNTEYVSAAVEITGFEKSSESAPPEPVLSFSNVDKGGYAILKEYDDLLNAKVTRIHTWAHFLDKLPDGSDNPDADPKGHNIPEIWYIEQKDGSDPTMVRWRLSSSMDLKGKMVPARTMLKTVCRRRYRYWDAKNGAWVYNNSPAACPYSGPAMYDRNSTPVTDPLLDRCPKNPRGCGDRFGQRNKLPGWFFPGIQRMPR